MRYIVKGNGQFIARYTTQQVAMTHAEALVEEYGNKFIVTVNDTIVNE